jgi:hypothetical protein
MEKRIQWSIRGYWNLCNDDKAEVSKGFSSCFAIVIVLYLDDDNMFT